HAQACCEVWEPGAEADRFVGSHDGYRALPDPVVHRREILWSRPDRAIAITDRIDCRETHIVEQFWHFSEHCQLIVEGSAVIAENQGVRIRLAPVEAPVEMLVKQGDQAGHLGWVSRRFAVKEPTNTLVWRSRITGATILETHITCFV
ncbi:MAG TPA: heparinase, partial [Mizugakiibacter sp.]|nr:heparinase [Mizugakiibacter sp.]